MHIRKTDLDIDLSRTPKKLISYDLFYRWVEKQKHNEPVFLMTDNRQTQMHFQNKYNTAEYPMQKILVYSNISDDRLFEFGNQTSADKQVVVKRGRKYKQQQQSLAIDHRFTSLEHAALDVFIAAHAWDFRTSPFSSVSDLVKMMNFLHRLMKCCLLT